MSSKAFECCRALKVRIGIFSIDIASILHCRSHLTFSCIFFYSELTEIQTKSLSTYPVYPYTSSLAVRKLRKQGLVSKDYRVLVLFQ